MLTASRFIFFETCSGGFRNCLNAPVAGRRLRPCQADQAGATRDDGGASFASETIDCVGERGKQLFGHDKASRALV